MDFRLKKWIDNALNLSFKLIFDQDIDLIEKYLQELKNANKATNARIDNVVLRSGGNSPNEVVDARTTAAGEIHKTLEARLNADSADVADKFDSTDEKLKSVEESNKKLEKTLKELYGEATQNWSIHVSKNKGNDDTGDGTMENPYKTIQRAANAIPKIVSGIDIEIICEPANYDEDVVIEAIFGARYVYLRSSNSTTVDAKIQDTGFYVRSVTFSSIAAQCILEGMTQSNAITQKDSIVNFLRVDYATIGNCRFDKNLKSTDKISIKYDQTRGGTVANCYFHNQNTILKAIYNSTCNFSSTNVMSGLSNYGIVSQRSIVYSDYEDADIVADTKVTRSNGGVIW
ncbi:hypothetical protein [Listeria innocua]|uniref:hypothetical protein n=1 Tax=Listeria innocua TaxID=1642 RepID=UPI0016284382|nr:hypothetical protein [Listeria innocua]MBC2132071.1 hypothetical protein [Listeria innocua]